ncbi:NAC domain-containing protein 71-like [Rosa rugosa]|uniref:NAC domain-containing protein 71-like n=1 Tax=Rosa rugosa TaxID=74645 RepID=UPI002B40DBFC|nr:NAC domain-containing protein 71-like [Rosa rugosa]
MAISCFMMSLEDLDVGVVKTFHPTDSDLVGSYLYNRIKSPTPIGGKQTFPEIEIYGTTGLPPWDIWRIYEPSKFPHQDYIYFFSRVKKLGSRCSRRIGCDGGTWSETEAAKPVYVSGIEEPYGKLRKFRYENNKDKGFEHHAAWLMDEYTINQAPDLALCRLKVNDKGAGGRKKRKKSSDKTNEDENHRKTKRVQVQNNTCEQQKGSASFSSTQQLPPQCDDHDYCMDENLVFSPTGLVDDYHDIFNSDEFLASLDQWYEEQLSDSSLLVPQQQVEPNNSCEEQQHQQDEQKLLPSPSLVHEQQLSSGFDLMVCGYDIPLDTPYLQSDEFYGFDQDQPKAL